MVGDKRWAEGDGQWVLGVRQDFDRQHLFLTSDNTHQPHDWLPHPQKPPAKNTTNPIFQVVTGLDDGAK